MNYVKSSNLIKTHKHCKITHSSNGNAFRAHRQAWKAIKFTQNMKAKIVGFFENTLVTKF